MSSIISISIDVTKIDKSKIKDGKYLNLQLFVNDETDAYENNVSVSHSQTKEERENKEKIVYLGNGRVVYVKDGIQTYQNCKSKPKNESNSQSDGLPF